MSGKLVSQDECRKNRQYLTIMHVIAIGLEVLILMAVT